jgi:hypothetical protein
MIVGSVFLVDVQMRLMLDAIAKMYSHHHCFPNSKPGNMIAILVANPHASTVFTRFQYDLDDIVLTAPMILLKNVVATVSMFGCVVP